MASDVEHIEAQRVALPDGAELLVRQVQPDDKQLLADGLRRLSPESRYRRFFRPLNEFSERDLAYLTEIDHRDHEALAGIDPDAIHHASCVFTVSSVRCRHAPTALLAPE